MDLSIIGIWKQIFPSNRSEEIFVEFRSNGELEYRIELLDKTQKILMQYKVDGNEIISNQPSHPREERTIFSFKNKDILVLDYGGNQSTYEKQL